MTVCMAGILKPYVFLMFCHLEKWNVIHSAGYIVSNATIKCQVEQNVHKAWWIISNVVEWHDFYSSLCFSSSTLLLNTVPAQTLNFPLTNLRGMPHLFWLNQTTPHIWDQYLTVPLQFSWAIVATKLYFHISQTRLRYIRITNASIILHGQK